MMQWNDDDNKAGAVRERLALLARYGPDDLQGWIYDPRWDRWARRGEQGYTYLQVGTVGEASAALSIIAGKWNMDRRAAMAFIGFPEVQP